LSDYRGFQLGMKLSAAAKQAGTEPSRARLIHQRPAAIQELDWQPRSPSDTDDPVNDGVLCFYNGELYRIVITYNRYKVEGMTPDDMVQAISETYGTATRSVAKSIAYRSIYGDTAPVLARWENAQSSYSLIQTPDRLSFAMILALKSLDALAQTAIAESLRLDALEAPQRELEKQNKRKDEERKALEKARSVNMPNFRP
jgi:hypothetical protein